MYAILNSMAVMPPMAAACAEIFHHLFTMMFITVAVPPPTKNIGSQSGAPALNRKNALAA